MLETRGMEGAATTLRDVTRLRTEIKLGMVNDLVLIDGGRVRSDSSATGVAELDGDRLERALLDRPVVVFGDWTPHYWGVEVLKRRKSSEKSMPQVRVVPRVRRSDDVHR